MHILSPDTTTVHLLKSGDNLSKRERSVGSTDECSLRELINCIQVLTIVLVYISFKFNLVLTLTLYLVYDAVKTNNKKPDKHLVVY